VLLGGALDVAAVARVARGTPVALSAAARDAMAANAASWEAAGAPDVLAFKAAWLVGPRADRVDPAERLEAFVTGHCAGVGAPLAVDQVRAMMLARANVLAGARSGCRPEAAEILIAMLNAGVHPHVPSQGSVGAAGDLAPLAHVARVACRLGGVAARGGRALPALEAIAGQPHFVPTPKEALSLINGSTLSAALAALACHRAERLLRVSELALAMSMEVALASADCLDARLLAARGHPAAVESAARVRALLAGSALAVPGRSPDDFSIRCAPAVLGAAWDAVAYARVTVERELGGACDNPLLIDGAVLEGGNFHGAPVGLAMDHLKVALTQAASIAERRVYRLTYGQLTGNLPSFLLEGSGLNSGFMLAQYTAASLVSECKGLAHPASVDSIPTGQHHEDHVSMAPIAARGALQIIDALAEVLSIEILVAAQGLDFRRQGVTWTPDGRRVQGPPAALAEGTAAALARVRARVPHWDDDRVLHRDQQAVASLVRGGEILADA